CVRFASGTQRCRPPAGGRHRLLALNYWATNTPSPFQVPAAAVSRTDALVIVEPFQPMEYSAPEVRDEIHSRPPARNMPPTFAKLCRPPALTTICGTE